MKKKSKLISSVLNAVKSFFLWTDKNEIAQCAIIATVLNLIIESLSRHSVFGGFEFFIKNFIFFVFSTAVIFTSLCIANFFAKRYAVLILISTLWLGLGVTNFIVRCMRRTPFEANDLLVLDGGFNIIFMYLGTVGFIAICLLVLLALALIVFLFIKIKKRRIVWKKATVSFLSSVLVLVLSLSSFKFTGISPQNFASLIEAYDNYGFVYCFGSSVFDRGISKPAAYSQKYIDSIISGLDEIKSVDEKELPSIVYVQLESFVDLNYMHGLKFSENPTPTFTYLKDNYTSGFLTVPSIGAGTANTEFEVMTGMRVFDFGTGEYPYKTKLQSSTCESVAYIYKNYGYQAHAIHNNTATFYDRNIVFPNLGFDRFTALEHMVNAETNPIGWAKDEVLVESILGVLDSTKGKDYIHAISVQGHGRYPSEKIDDSQTITILPEYAQDYPYVNEMEYFANQLNEMDDFISELITKLDKREEKVTVVFYGDHFPSINISDEELSDGSIYQTEYVIWSNYEDKEAEDDDRDLYSYQLSSYVSYRLGVNNGIINRLHQKNFVKESKKYLEHLESLEYDMLYGKNYANRGAVIYSPTEMKLGIYDIVLKKVSYDQENGVITVYGENLNRYCEIFVNGKRHKNTDFVSTEKLSVRGDLGNGDKVCVVQMSSQWMLRLGQTNEITYIQPTK